jgi:hypothetical protein
MRHSSRCLFAVIFLWAIAAARAADMKLEATLVWGTDDDKPAANCKPLDPDLAAKLHGMFKWKSYFEITNQTATIAQNTTCDMKMSEHCTLQIRNLGTSRVEISCIGKGKPVHKGAYTLVPPKWTVFGGNDSNDTAWFIALRPVPDKPGLTAKTAN